MADRIDVAEETLGRFAELKEEIEKLPVRLPTIPIPILTGASGLYVFQLIIPKPLPITRPPVPGPIPEFPPQPGPPIDGAPRVEGELEEEGLVPPYPMVLREELRLDVDGRYPQMVASGTAGGLLTNRVHWIARLTSTGPDSWKGPIWFKEGSVSWFPFTTVQIQAVRSWFPSQRSARVTFSGAGQSIVRVYAFKSPYFHPVDFEFDCVEGETATTIIDTCAHPNHPATLACEQLSIQTVYQRAGFDVTTSPGGPVPIAGAGSDAKWSDKEMHDAMQSYWSHWANKPQWALWCFFASLHEMGDGLGGIMFDDIGPNHRQGTAIFNDSFISRPPANEPQQFRAAWVRRMIFWTACHEMGHTFNLAHSWDKSKGTPWIPLLDEPEARSFMNYPYRVTGGQTAFFADFQYRFSNGELLFMRHAPERYVEQGNANWFDHHGFQEANTLPESTFKLELRVNRDKPRFEFLEPAVFELKLTNDSRQIQLVDPRVLSNLESMTIIVKRNGQPARRFEPHQKYCFQPDAKALQSGESIYESLFLGAGLGGWYIAEPGKYRIQVAIHLPGEDVVSNPLDILVQPPHGREEEFLAQDYFSDDVGRIVAFDGSRYLSQGNDVLREVASRLPDRKVAIHANVALGEALRCRFKEFVVTQEADQPFSIKVEAAHEAEADKMLQTALVGEAATAVESLGHIDYKNYMDDLSDWLASQGETGRAAEVQDSLRATLESRRVQGRPILDRVIREVEAKRGSYLSQRSATAPKVRK